MNEFRKVHVIDPIYIRKAEVTRTLLEIGLAPEPYESVDDFKASVRSPGLVLLGDDGRLGSLESLHLIQDLEDCYSTVVYSDESDLELAVKALTMGAINFLTWPMERAALVRSMETCRAQASTNDMENSKKRDAQKLVSTLSNRETQVIAQLINGLTNKEIAQVLDISPRTVEIHRGNALKKLGVNSSGGAIRLGIYAGLDA